MANLFTGPITYSVAQQPGVRNDTFNGDGTEVVGFYVNTDPYLNATYTYTVTITDSFGSVHVRENFDGGGNDYYGALTGYHNGGAFTVVNYTEGPTRVSNSFTWMFTSSVLQSGTITLYNDARGGAFVPPVCFVQGTLLLTSQGEKPVETLSVGDLVITSSGQARPIRWIGRRSLHCKSAADPRLVWPVRIAAHAFGDNRPHRDLLISPGHALCVTCVDDVLINAENLLNGSTIVQQKVDNVGYWHVELDTHDILIANGMPAESYLEMGNRHFFADSEVIALHARPDAAARTHADFCRLYVDSGPILDAVRQQLQARAQRMGWRADATFNCHVVIDGRKFAPVLAGASLFIQAPATAKDIRLICETFVPHDLDNNGDRRALGLGLQRLCVRDASVSRIVALDDARLSVGFYEVERDGESLWRWTRNEALLPHSLWEGLTGEIEITLDLMLPFRGWRQENTRTAPSAQRKIA